MHSTNHFTFQETWFENVTIKFQCERKRKCGKMIKSSDTFLLGSLQIAINLIYYLISDEPQRNILLIDLKQRTPHVINVFLYLFFIIT